VANLGGTRCDGHRLAPVTRLARQPFPGHGIPGQLFANGTRVIPGQVSRLTRPRCGKLNRLIFSWRVNGYRSGVQFMPRPELRRNRSIGAHGRIRPCVVVLPGWLQLLPHGGRVPAEGQDRLVLASRYRVLKVVHGVLAGLRVLRVLTRLWILARLRLVERGRAEASRRAKVIRGGCHRLRECVNPIRLSQCDILAARLPVRASPGPRAPGRILHGAWLRGQRVFEGEHSVDW
jgi:hypothetical protein